MKIKKIDIFILSLLFIISFSFYIHYSTPILWSPDEMSYFLSSQKFIENGNINVSTPLNEKYGTCAFNYGFTVFKSCTEQYSGIFSGAILFHSIIMFTFGESAFFLVSPLLGTIGVLTIYLTAREIFKSRCLGIFAALNLFTLPIWIRWSTEHYTNIPMTTFFFLSFLSLVALKEDRKYLISGIFLSISILIRLPTLLLIIPFAFYLYMESTKKNQFILFFSPIIVTILLILPFFKWIMYGDPFFLPLDNVNYYPSILLQDAVPLRLYQHFSLALGERNAILQSIYFIFSQNFAYLFFPISFIGLILLYKEKKNISLFILFVFLLLLVLHGRGYEGYGFGRATLQSTLLRYMLPAYGLLSIGFACLLKNIFKKVRRGKLLVSVFLLIYIVSTLSFTVAYPDYGLNAFEKYRSDHLIINNKIDELIESDSIIICDEVTLVSSTSSHMNIIYYPDIPTQIRDDEIKRIIKMALIDNYSIYFTGGMYEESNWRKENLQMLNSIQDDYKVKKLDEILSIEIYKISLRD